MPLGRTNSEFPNLWLDLRMPASSSEIEPMASLVRKSELPVDFSGFASLWGNALRGSANPKVVSIGRALKTAVDVDHATDLVQAELIEVLCSIGTDKLDVLTLHVPTRLQEYQIEGALRCLELARQEGHVSFFALRCGEESFGAQMFWQIRDAFELFIAPQTVMERLGHLADERRVGRIVSEVAASDYVAEDGKAQLVIVESLTDLEQVGLAKVAK